MAKKAKGKHTSHQKAAGRTFGCAAGSRELALPEFQSLRSEEKTFTGEQKVLTLAEVNSQPRSIVWENFDKDPLQVLAACKAFPCNLAVSIVVWFISYSPCLAFTYQYARTMAGSTGNLFMVQNILVGVICAVGNAVIAGKVAASAEALGSVKRDRMDEMSLVGMFIGTFFTMVADVLVMLMWLTPAFVAHFRMFSGDSPVPTYTDALAQQFWGLMFPGYLLVPYLLEPVFSVLVPWLLASKIIKSRSVSLVTSAASLRCPDVDLVNPYSDVILNVSICVSCVFITSEVVCRILVGLLCFVVCRYLYFMVLFGTQSSVREDSTDGVSTVALILWGMPTGILAAGTTFWGSRWYFGLELPPLGLPGGPRHWEEGLAKTCTWLLPVLAFVAHFAMHFLWIRILLKPMSAKRMPKDAKKGTLAEPLGPVDEYEKVYGQNETETASYFNTNQALVLLSHRGGPVAGNRRLPRAVRRSGRPIRPFAPGWDLA